MLPNDYMKGFNNTVKQSAQLLLVDKGCTVWGTKCAVVDNKYTRHIMDRFHSYQQ